MGLQQDSRGYSGFRRPGVRLNEELLPALAEHRTEKLGDTLEAIHTFDKAHLVMLVERGLIPRADGVAMLRELRAMEAEGILAVRMRVQGGSHSAEQYLIRVLGEAVGGRIHLGRSSGDLSEVGRRYTIRQHLLRHMGNLNRFRRVLVEIAPQHLSTVMPGFTHGQDAQPTTFGHWLSMWACVFERDFARAGALYQRVNQSPAGAGILCGSDFDLDRERTSQLLGFDGPLRNTMDAILSHDAVLLETASVLMIHASSMARLAEDFELWFSSEFSFIDMPDRYCDTSSIMAQKRNPLFSEEVKATAAAVYGGLTTAIAVESGPTGLAMNEHRATQSALWSNFAEIDQRLNEAIGLLPEITVNKARMLAVANDTWTQAADLAGGIVRLRGLPWRTAHQIVAILVRLSYERDIKPREVTPTLLDEAAMLYWDRPLRLSESELRDLLLAERSVERRTLLGGPAPEAASRELAILTDRLNGDEGTHAEAVQHVESAARELERSISLLLEDTADAE